MTYEEYYNQWQLSTESRDLTFDEWLCLMLDRQKAIDIEKACEWIRENVDKYYVSSSQADDCFFDSDNMLEDFRKAAITR